MSTLEDDIRDALRGEAVRLREVRPLRLPPAAGPVPRRQALPGRRRARWLKTWMPPLTAAAMVLALAISLVTAKNVHDERGAPAVSPALGRYGIPRFYVTLPAPEPSGEPMRSLVVGDTFTGAKVATVAAPKGTQFTGVSAAGDGRTFLFARVLDLRAGGGDLLQDSRVVWSLEAPGPHGTWSYVGPLLGCGFPYLTPSASAVVCAGTSWTNPPGGMVATTHWAAFRASVPAKGRVTCRITFSVPGQSKAVAIPQVYWMSPSGDTLVSSDGATSRIGIVRHGVFTALPVDGANPAEGDLAL
jgi:hypothetical protein